MAKKTRHDKRFQAVSTSQVSETLENDLGSAVGLPQSMSLNAVAHNLQGVFGGNGYGAQVSQTDTMYRNLRQYLVSNQRQLLSQSYAEIGLISTVVDVPVEDALKGGIHVKTKQLSEKDIVKLNNVIEYEGDLTHAAEAAKWKRLFGGAAILVLVDDQDPEDELDISAITTDTRLEFRAVDMWELFYDRQYLEGDDTSIEFDEIDNLDRCYNYYGERIHKSRVMKMKGKKPPSFMRPRLQGWGLSIVETVVRSINQYMKSTDLSFEVLDEFKLDIYKLKGLSSALLSPKGEENIRKRVQIANQQKNYQNAIVLDSEDGYESKQLSFTGIAEAGTGIRMQVASDLRMPITKIFGISAQGFNSGEDDIEVYNSMIESSIRTPLKYDLLKIVQIRCQKEFGFIPDDLTIEYKPLRILSAEQEETVKDKKFNRLLAAKTAGEISTLEFRNACNRANLLDITLDTTDDSILPDDADQVKGGSSGSEALEEDEGEDDEGEEDSNVLQGNFGAGSFKAKERATNSLGLDQAITTATFVKRKKVRQKYAVLPPIYTPRQKRKRRRLKNSSAFDRASYEADGGDNWIDDRRSHFFEKPVGVDQALWNEALEATRRVFGNTSNWKFTAWMYRKLGGIFG